MDKPDHPIRGKVILQSVSHTDEMGIQLDLVYERRWTLELQDYADQVQITLFRPESQLNDRLRISRRLDHSEIELLLAALTKVVRLVHRRQHMQERPPEQGVEFSIVAVDGILVGTNDFRGKEPSYFLELSKDEDVIRMGLATVNELESVRNLLQSAR